MTHEASAEDAPERPRRRRGSVGVSLVAGLAGLLFVTNASIFDSDDDRRPESLLELARAEAERMQATEAEVVALRSQIEEHLDGRHGEDATLDPDTPVTLAAARSAVTGPGIVVSLWDAPIPVNLAASEVHPDDLVVHQQDLEAVMNALWAGGAEAMMVQDQRITATSAVRCVGNVLLLHGRHYSPPYRVSVIGDPILLQQALEASPGVGAYLHYVEVLNLGWSVEIPETIEMPAYTGRTRMEYAQVPVAYADPQTRADTPTGEEEERDGDH